MSINYDNEYRQVLVKMRDKAGRAEIASSLQEPLRELQDYIGVGRSILLQDILPDGTEFRCRKI